MGATATALFRDGSRSFLAAHGFGPITSRRAFGLQVGPDIEATFARTSWGGPSPPLALGGG